MLTNEVILESQVLLAKSKLLSLEDQDGLNLIISLVGMELVDGLEIGDSKLKHVQ